MAGGQDGDNILICAIAGLRGHKLDKAESFGGFLDASIPCTKVAIHQASACKRAVGW